MAPDPDHSAAAGRAGRGDLMERTVDGAIRLGRAWKSLTRERRVAAVAAGVLWLTLFLPWYQASVVGRSFRTRGAMPVSESFSGWASFGLVQALILILSLGILAFLFLRAEGRAGELPGGDGWTVTGAGGLSVFLVILGLFSAPSPAGRGHLVLSTGLEWGIFLALVAAAVLAWAGNRIRHSVQDDPFLAENRRAAAQDEPSAAEPERSPAERESPPAEPPPPPPEPASGSGPDEAPTRTAEPLTAAGARKDPAHPTPVAADPPPEPRSSWRPAERPDWTDPERPMGWLTAPPKHQRSEEETGQE